MRRSRLTSPSLTLALALGVVLAGLSAGPALAASYRYWSFWDGAGGTWAYASVGPSTARPADGSVQGFRFSVSRDAAAEAARPRAAADFTAICAATPAAAGTKRVALVIDFGDPADAPTGGTPPQAEPRTACARVAQEATAAEALASVAKPLRYNSAALLCGVSGYPEQGCGEPLPDTPDASAAAQATDASAPTARPQADDGGGPSVGLLAGVAAVAALAAAGIWQSRRRAR